MHRLAIGHPFLFVREVPSNEYFRQRHRTPKATAIVLNGTNLRKVLSTKSTSVLPDGMAYNHFREKDLLGGCIYRPGRYELSGS